MKCKLSKTDKSFNSFLNIIEGPKCGHYTGDNTTRIFNEGWNSALEEIKSCLPNIFALYNTRPTEKELRKLLKELKVKEE